VAAWSQVVHTVQSEKLGLLTVTKACSCIPKHAWIACLRLAQSQHESKEGDYSYCFHILFKSS